MEPLPSSSGLNRIPWSNKLSFTLNGRNVEIINPDPSELLVTYVREKAGLCGTKLGCEEGGCGACSVMLQDHQGHYLAVNSCLRLLCSNDGMNLTTVEGIGSVKDGLSIEQQSIVKHNGTQCGFCTPGWVTAMHALKSEHQSQGVQLRPKDIDKSFDGNLCRCTGYRPIMQAFHTICYDKEVNDRCHSQVNASCVQHLRTDIEDYAPYCPAPNSKFTSSKASTSARVKAYVPQPLFFYNVATGKKYYRPVTIQQLCAVLREYPQTAKLVRGNTSIGVTKYLNGSEPYYVSDEHQVLVDIYCLEEFNAKEYDANTRTITLGAALSINEVIKTLKQYVPHTGSEHDDDRVDYSSVFSVTANHIGKVANTQLRNAASWAGNVMMTLQYPSFASDVVLALLTARAVLIIGSHTGNTFQIPVEELFALGYDEAQRRGYFVVGVKIANTNSQDRVISETSKIAEREHNAHALMDAGFSFKLSSQPSALPPVCAEARIVYGAVGKKIFIARRTQQTLQGAPLTTRTLQDAFAALRVDWLEAGINLSSPLVDIEFLSSSMQAALYQAFLRCYPLGSVQQTDLSALLPWTKPSSKGVEVFPIVRDNSNPVHKPVKKLEAPIQTTGEAVYPSDELLSTNGLHGAIIFSSRCAVTLQKIDASYVLQQPGVVAVYTAVDIPGSNDLQNNTKLFIPIGDIVPYVGAPLAVIITTSEEIANKLVRKVQITYSEVQGTVPIVSLQQAINANSYFKGITPPLSKITAGDTQLGFQQSTAKIDGSVIVGGQYHFYMETQTAISQLIDGEIVRVICGTQDPTAYQDAIANILGVKSNQVIVQCPRAGGGFGGKIRGGLTVAASTALATSKLRTPVKIFNTRTADMNMQGGREEWMANYQIGCDAQGLIKALQYNFYVDSGSSDMESQGGLYMGMCWADNAYYLPNYLAEAKLAKTNTPGRTSMRAPGVVSACFITEMVIERVATELQLPLHVVQERNFITNGETTICGQTITDCTLQEVWNKAKKSSKFDDRYAQISLFNSQNRWRKRGIAISPVKYGMGWAGYNAGVKVAVRSSDGYVLITHNGVEIGQGINTKVTQAVAMALSIDYHLIRVERTSTDVVANGGTTGGSGTSEVVVQAALNACATLNARLDPYRKTAKTSARTSTMSDKDWLKLLKSLPTEVSLNCEGWFSPSQNPNEQAFQYFVYAACVTEVELDVLTGRVHVLSADLVYDCGQSLNPAVDIGQIEGAFVMGLGLIFQEKVVYSESDGTLRTPGTWEYKPPFAQDIPSVFNVTLIGDSYNTAGILGSKATGEPPYVIANSAYFATKLAIYSARADAGVRGYYNLPVPATVDERLKACLVQSSRLKLPA